MRHDITLQESGSSSSKRHCPLFLTARNILQVISMPGNPTKPEVSSAGRRKSVSTQVRPMSQSTTREIAAAALERPINPTIVEDQAEIQRLKTSKWLPPLAESARALTTPNAKSSSRSPGGTSDSAHVGMGGAASPSGAPYSPNHRKKSLDDKPRSPRKHHNSLPRIESTSLPNIPLSNNRFPRKELKRATQAKKALWSNPNRRFIVAIAERAFKEEARARHREEEIKKVQEASGAIAWHIIRPLSRDPKFGRYIVALQNANT
ncbi:hypothetical protein BC829DRAFT_241191 [Chytridium lagenaria]|nr:hypothetical protein BC829DRAFT_241191 [Chytridium lagenaria]